MTDLRLGLVGAGAVAQTYAQALAGVRGARLTAIADTRVEAATAMAAAIGAKAFDSAEALAARGECDGVIVCTPPASHPRVCHVLLTHGIHVLCEKPLAVDLESAQAMFRAADEACVILTMCSKFMFVEDIVKARSLVTSGILGEVVRFENQFTSRVDMTNRWNADPAIGGGGVIIDNGTHSINIMRYLAGPLSAVHATEAKRVQHTGVEDTALILARTSDGVLGSIELSWSFRKPAGSYIAIHGVEGTLRVGWSQSQYRRTADADWTTFGNGYHKLEAFRRQLENFRAAIRGEEPLAVTTQDAIASVSAVAACYTSLRTGAWAAVDDDPQDARRRVWRD